MAGQDEFSKRLAGALKRPPTALGAVTPAGASGAAGGAPAGVTAQMLSTPGAQDLFSQRLAQALTPPTGVAPAAGTNAPPGGEEDDEPVDSAGPAGTGERMVREGECISSIAYEVGHHWETIWDDGGNSELRANRSSPYTLRQGDLVHVPPLRRKDESGATEMRHRFRRLGAPEKFRVRLCQFGKPRSNLSYTLMVDGTLFSGVTDAEGLVEQLIPPNAKRGKLIISQDEQYDVQLGALDPVSEEAGVLARLVNLEYLAEEDRDEEEAVIEALKEFQRKQGLTVSGEADQETRQRLVTVHGC